MTIYHDLKIQTLFTNFEYQYDHIMVTPYAIIVIETKFWKGKTYVTQSAELMDLFCEENEHYFYTSKKDNSDEKPVLLFNVQSDKERDILNIKTYMPIRGVNVLKNLQKKTNSLYDKFNEKIATRSILLFVDTNINQLIFQNDSLKSLLGYIRISTLTNLEKTISVYDGDQSLSLISAESKKEIMDFFESKAKYVQDVMNPECRHGGRQQ